MNDDQVSIAIEDVTLAILALNPNVPVDFGSMSDRLPPDLFEARYQSPPPPGAGTRRPK